MKADLTAASMAVKMVDQKVKMSVDSMVASMVLRMVDQRV